MTLSEDTVLNEDTIAVKSPPSILVGRQAIFDVNMGVYAYELLYRDSEARTASFADGDIATAKVMANTFFEFGIDVVTGGKPAFINLTKTVIGEEVAHLFPADRIVIEILEDIVPDTETIEKIQALKDSGYTIALDDFVLTPEAEPFVKLADIIKLDVLELGLTRTAEHIARLKPLGIKILAEKVETHEMFAACVDLGCDYFQGYFLCRPQILEVQRKQSVSLGVIELLSRINNPRSTVAELEQAICQDASLSYRLMKYINSAAFSLTVKVESIRHSLMLLGNRMVKVWVNLVILSGLKGKSPELLTTALVRARMCQTLGCKESNSNHDVFFTAGLFSILDALVDMPMKEVVKNLPISDELVKALVSQEGIYGKPLRVVMLYERGAWSEIDENDYSADTLKDAYFDALRWVSKVLSVESKA